MHTDFFARVFQSGRELAIHYVWDSPTYFNANEIPSALKYSRQFKLDCQDYFLKYQFFYEWDWLRYYTCDSHHTWCVIISKLISAMIHLKVAIFYSNYILGATFTKWYNNHYQKSIVWRSLSHHLLLRLYNFNINSHFSVVPCYLTQSQEKSHGNLAFLYVINHQVGKGLCTITTWFFKMPTNITVQILDLTKFILCPKISSNSLILLIISNQQIVSTELDWVIRFFAGGKCFCMIVVDFVFKVCCETLSCITDAHFHVRWLVYIYLFNIK